MLMELILINVMEDVIMAIMGVLLIGINVKVIVHVQMRLLRFKTLVIPFTIPLFLLILPLMKFLKF
jgi:hypothetical protein